MKKTVRISRANADRVVTELGNLRFKLIEASAEVTLLREERTILIEREVALALENRHLRDEIDEVAKLILELNARLGALVAHVPNEVEEHWFQLFPSRDWWGADVVAIQTSNAEGDNWQTGIPVTEDNAVLLGALGGMLDLSKPNWSADVPASWIYSALDAALDHTHGDREGGVASNLLHWMDDRTGHHEKSV